MNVNAINVRGRIAGRPHLPRRCDDGLVGATQNPTPLTIKTIAKAAGVHPSTVSRALAPTTDGHIGDDTVKRIRALADSLGYEPNPWARNLRTRRSLTIGLVMPRLTDFLAQMFEGAEDRARQSQRRGRRCVQRPASGTAGTGGTPNGPNGTATQGTNGVAHPLSIGAGGGIFTVATATVDFTTIIGNTASSQDNDVDGTITP